MNYFPTSREASCFTELTCPASSGQVEVNLSTGFKSGGPRPISKTFLAAFRSLSNTSPQHGHTCTLTDRDLTTTTPTTPLRRTTGIHEDHSATRFLLFVAEHPNESSPSRIRYGLGEAAVPDHVPDLQVLHVDGAVAIRHGSAGLVQEVAAAILDLLVQPGDSQAGSHAIPASLLLAGEASL